ncbi:MAG: hypothetical protein NUV50_11265 [Rhodospirillales bacterium]|nr:hypothetical protein [Rhodospirillales bacterium]
MQALNNRLAHAEKETDARNCKNVLNDFGAAVEHSNVAISQPLALIAQLIKNQNHLYSTFYNQRDGRQRLPEENKYDLRRESVDTSFFPHYHDHIVFGALTLNDQGPPEYGGHSIILKEEMIAHRASVFDSNTYIFAEKHNLRITAPIPYGYRSSWSDRGKLAKAKLHHKISQTTQQSDYANILMGVASDDRNTDFLEVHIYRGFNRNAVKKVMFTKANMSGKSTAGSADKLMFKSLKKTLDDLGILHEEV